MSDAVDMYRSGLSLRQVSAATGTPVPTLRYRFMRAGVLRDRTTGIRLAGTEGRLSQRGPRGPYAKSHGEAVSKARNAWAEKHAKGTRINSQGYVEYTRGPHKGKRVHVVLIEERLGRRLRSDECVHHIDGDRQNNHINNLALMTFAAHARLHRREEKLRRTECPV